MVLFLSFIDVCSRQLMNILHAGVSFYVYAYMLVLLYICIVDISIVLKLYFTFRCNSNAFSPLNCKFHHKREIADNWNYDLKRSYN